MAQDGGILELNWQKFDGQGENFLILAIIILKLQLDKKNCYILVLVSYRLQKSRKICKNSEGYLLL